MTGGLSFLRTGPANMVYSCPETVSDVYVNQGERLQKGGRTREKGERGRGGTEGVRREEFAKMPSHGSLKQAVKVRPGRGEKKEGREKKTLSGFVELFMLQVEKHFLHIGGIKLIFSHNLSQKVYHLLFQHVLMYIQKC